MTDLILQVLEFCRVCDVAMGLKRIYILHVRQTLLPTMAPEVWSSIIARSIDIWAVKIWGAVDPGATQVKAESHRGVDIEGRDWLHDHGWLCRLALQVGA
jgi:hypothetical protein